MRNALFDAEDVGFAPAVPAAEFSAGEEEGYKEEEDGGVAPAGAAAGVSGFDFRWCALVRSQTLGESSDNGIEGGEDYM